MNTIPVGMALPMPKGPLPAHRKCVFIGRRDHLKTDRRCGKKTVVGSSYCKDHHTIVWIPLNIAREQEAAELKRKYRGRGNINSGFFKTSVERVKTGEPADAFLGHVCSSCSYCGEDIDGVAVVWFCPPIIRQGFWLRAHKRWPKCRPRD